MRWFVVTLNCHSEKTTNYGKATLLSLHLLLIQALAKLVPAYYLILNSKNMNLVFLNLFLHRYENHLHPLITPLFFWWHYLLYFCNDDRRLLHYRGFLLFNFLMIPITNFIRSFPFSFWFSGVSRTFLSCYFSQSFSFFSTCNLFIFFSILSR